MKSKLIKILSVVIILTLVLSALVGCQTENKAPEESSSGKEDPPQPEARLTGRDALNAYTPLTIDGEKNLQTYPIVDEKITLKFWYPMGDSMGELDDFNDGDFFKWYEEKTNIHIDFIVPAAGTEADTFQLLFASGEMPDLLFSRPDLPDTSKAQAYRGGEDASIEDGYFVDVLDYLDAMPNYMSWVMKDDREFLRRAVLSDGGHMAGMYAIIKPMSDDGKVMGDRGPAIRQDFLDKVNKEVPTTYEEWEDVLIAFRDELGIEAPFYTSKLGRDHGEFMAGYGIAPEFYLDGTTVKFGPMEDGYKEYLEMMSRWYTEKLLDQDFATRKSKGVTADDDMMLNDKVGALTDYSTRVSDTYISRGATNEEFNLVATEQPTKEGSDITPNYRYLTGSDLLNQRTTVFSADGEHIEEAIRWMDGFYARDIYLDANYGLENMEGKAWHLKENPKEEGDRIGDYDYRYDNPDGLSSATVIVKYWVRSSPLFVEAAQAEQGDQIKQDSYKIWSKYPQDGAIPIRAKLSVEEMAEYGPLYADINSYVEENIVKFINGDRPMSEYDKFRTELEGLNIDQCIKLKQASYDRYLAR